MPKGDFNTLRHGCSPASLLHIFRTPFLKNTSGRMLLALQISNWNYRTSCCPIFYFHVVSSGEQI